MTVFQTVILGTFLHFRTRSWVMNPLSFQTEHDEVLMLQKLIVTELWPF